MSRSEIGLRVFLFTAICLCISAVKAQETDFFWSFEGLNHGAVNGPASETFAVGETGTMYLYYSTNGPADSDLKIGAMLDIATSRNGVIRFTSAETFEFEISIQGILIDTRWSGSDGSPRGAFGKTGTIGDEFINELGAFTYAADGIREFNNGSFLNDAGYDAGADAFLFARVDFEVINDTHGSTDIVASPGRGLVVGEPGNACEAVSLDVSFGNATIQVFESILLGDVDQNGAVDLLDVAPFTFLLTNKEFQDEADIDRDGFVTLLDVAGFVTLIIGQHTPVDPPPEPQDNLLGDMNCDGFIDLKDIPCVVSFFNDGICDFATADANQDGTVDLWDAIALIDLILEQE